ncbi:glycosyltransferase family 39 protein, partial [bacterium]|nr:glycosyltransferase family 39 protein [bacterium]
MTDTVKNKNNLIITCFVFCLILFLFFILVSINKPFIFDEADYAGFSRGIVEKGLPLYYHSEEHMEGFEAGGKYFEGEFGLYHQPLLHSYALALFYRLFGEHNFTGRAFGIVCNLGVLVLMLLTIKSLYPKGEMRLFVAVASACLVLTNPLQIQGGMLIDIDNTVLSLLLAFFLLVFVKYYNARFLNRVISWPSVALGAILTLLFWVKLTTPLFLPAAIFIFYSLNGRIKHGLFLSLFIFTVGIGLFILTWGIFCKTFNWSFTRMFEIAFARFFQLSGAFDLRERMRTLKWDMFWFSPAFYLCFIVSVLERIKRYIKLRKCDLIDLFLSLCIMMFIMYTLIIPNPYPKYKVPAVFLLSIVISDLMYGIIPGMVKRELKVSLIVIIGLTFYYSY